MSYILDALKRADSERERGTVPGIHAQPAPLAPAGTGGDRTSRRLLWLGAGVAVAAALMLVLRWAWKDTPVPTVMPVPVAQSAPPVAVPAVPAPVVVAVAPPEVPSLPAALPAPAPAAATAARTATVSAAPAAPASTTRSAPVPTAAQAAVVAPPPTEARIPALAELPEDLRRQLPPLVISGSVYSDSPAQRMLIINGQIFREADKPGPEVVIEQIRPKSAVFSFRGTRYSIAY